MKVCARCQRLKVAAEFNRNGRRKDGLQHYCRSCHRESVTQSQRTHRDAFLKRQRCYNNRKRDEFRRNIFVYLKAHPCVDCGEADVIVLDFDHRRDKKHTISQLVYSNKSWEEILGEIEKCEIRCANCHRRKTARQFGWKKYLWQVEDLEGGRGSG